MPKLKLLTLKLSRVWRSTSIGFLLLTSSVVVIAIILRNFQPQHLEVLQTRRNNLQQGINKLTITANSQEKLKYEQELFLVEKDWANAQNAFYGILIQALGGAFFFVTAYLTLRNVKATEQKQVTERFSKAIEQLESDKPAVQLGGIYALERIASDSYKDHWTIMEVLTYLVQATSPNDLQGNNQPITAVIQAALTVIGRRNFDQDQEGKKLYLSNTNLTKVNLKDTYFRGAILEGSDLREANLENADFREAYFGDANLSRANLNSAKLDNINRVENFSVNRINFAYASLSKAKLRSALLTGANLHRADLTKADLRQAYLYRADLSAAILVLADLRGADLSQANLRGANLANTELSNTNLHNADIYDANFCDAIGLNLGQIKTAQHWEHAIYSKAVRKALGLPPEAT